MDEQSKQFMKTARELGCDESEERFDDALRKVGKQKAKEPEPRPEIKPKGQKAGKL